MRKNITRTITESTIHAVRISFVDGMPVATDLAPVVVVGSIKPEKALKAVYAEHGKSSDIHIKSIDEQECLYEISVKDFMAHAKRVTEETPDEDTDEE